MPIIGRFVRVAKAKRPRRRRVARMPGAANTTAEGIEALNANMERAVTASLSGGMRRFRRDVQQMELDTAFSSKDYTSLKTTVAWKTADEALGRAARGLSAMVPQTQAEVVRGIASGTTGNAAGDARLTEPIDFDHAFGRTPAKARAPAQAAGRLSQNMTADNPELKEHAFERRKKYLTDLFMPQRAEVQRIAAQAGVSSARRAQQVKEVLRPEGPNIVGEALSYRIGLNRIQVGSLDRQEDADRQAGLSDERINENLKTRSDAMLEDRCRTIAVTEARAASGAAQLQTWLAMQQEGLIGADARKVWILGSEEACPDICRPVDNVSVPLDEDFTLGNGKPCSMGGLAHPRCRCGTVLYDPDVDGDAPVRNEDAFPDAEDDA